jgi:hypothetical protein
VGVEVASGFLILSDGSCFAPHFSFYDEVLEVVAGHLDGSPPARFVKDWLLSLLPGPKDENLGYAWIRVADRQVIPRLLDLRELTIENQKLFHQAVRAVGEQIRLMGDPIREMTIEGHLVHLADMVSKADRGEPPLSHSMWTSVTPHEGRKTGPGW